MCMSETSNLALLVAHVLKNWLVALTTSADFQRNSNHSDMPIFGGICERESSETVCNSPALEGADHQASDSLPFQISVLSEFYTFWGVLSFIPGGSVYACSLFSLREFPSVRSPRACILEGIPWKALRSCLSVVEIVTEASLVRVDFFIAANRECRKPSPIENVWRDDPFTSFPWQRPVVSQKENKKKSQESTKARGNWPLVSRFSGSEWAFHCVDHGRLGVRDRAWRSENIFQHYEVADCVLDEESRVEQLGGVWTVRFCGLGGLRGERWAGSAKHQKRWLWRWLRSWRHICAKEHVNLTRFAIFLPCLGPDVSQCFETQCHRRQHALVHLKTDAESKETLSVEWRRLIAKITWLGHTFSDKLNSVETHFSRNNSRKKAPGRKRNRFRQWRHRPHHPV